jgi:hypothetical protein
MCFRCRTDKAQVQQKQLAKSQSTASDSKPQMSPGAHQEEPFLSESMFANMGTDFVLLEADDGQQRLMGEFLGDVAEMGVDPNVGGAIREVSPIGAHLARADT